MLITNFAIAGGLLIATCAVQFAGMVGLAWFMRRALRHHPARFGGVIWQGGAIILIVMGLFALHSIQIWFFALTYIAIGEFNALEPALYFATSTFTTVGFGDIVLGEKWRMLAAAGSANGFLLIGWSTAFLVSVSARVRIFEADIERLDKR